MKKLDIQKQLLERYKDELYVILFAFGGACSQKQLLRLEEFSSSLIKDLTNYNILKTEIIDRHIFLICKNAVYKHFNIDQNYRLTAYNIKKSCLLTEYWLLCHNSIKTIISTINKGNLHQFKARNYNEYITYLHSQGCYIRFLTDNPKTIYFVFFPKSSNPKTIAIFIKSFFDSILTLDNNTVYRFSIRLSSQEHKNKILKHIDGRYWYILDKLHFFELNCDETLNII